MSLHLPDKGRAASWHTRGSKFVGYVTTLYACEHSSLIHEFQAWGCHRELIFTGNARAPAIPSSDGGLS